MNQSAKYWDEEEARRIVVGHYYSLDEKEKDDNWDRREKLGLNSFDERTGGPNDPKWFDDYLRKVAGWSDEKIKEATERVVRAAKLEAFK